MPPGVVFLLCIDLAKAFFHILLKQKCDIMFLLNQKAKLLPLFFPALNPGIPPFISSHSPTLGNPLDFKFSLHWKFSLHEKIHHCHDQSDQERDRCQRI